MAQWNIHFDGNGEIKQIDNSPAPEKIGVLDHISIESDTVPSIHSLTHKVVHGVLIEKNDAEKAVALLPTPFEVKAAIYAELCATDAWAMPDRPMTDTTRSAWTTYRQTLRDLSKLASPTEMIVAWPVRPDGVDAVVGLRGRVPV
jgi:hypothetical protein